MMAMSRLNMTMRLRTEQIKKRAHAIQGYTVLLNPSILKSPKINLYVYNSEPKKELSSMKMLSFPDPLERLMKASEKPQIVINRTSKNILISYIT